MTKKRPKTAKNPKKRVNSCTFLPFSVLFPSSALCFLSSGFCPSVSNPLFSWLHKRPMNRPVDAGRPGVNARICKPARPRTHSLLNPLRSLCPLWLQFFAFFAPFAPKKTQKSATFCNFLPLYPLNFNLFMQNEPNFQITPIAITPAILSSYSENRPRNVRKNEPKTNPNKANLLFANIKRNSCYNKHLQQKSHLPGQKKQ